MFLLLKNLIFFQKVQRLYFHFFLHSANSKTQRKNVLQLISLQTWVWSQTDNGNTWKVPMTFPSSLAATDSQSFPATSAATFLPIKWSFILPITGSMSALNKLRKSFCYTDGLMFRSLFWYWVIPHAHSDLIILLVFLQIFLFFPCQWFRSDKWWERRPESPECTTWTGSRLFVGQQLFNLFVVIVTLSCKFANIGRVANDGFIRYVLTQLESIIWTDFKNLLIPFMRDQT